MIETEVQPSFEVLYAAVKARSADFDGVYFTGVRTTRIFCRPTCPARTPLPQNVEFFSSVQMALQAGYRACKRCRPLELAEVAPEWIKSLVGDLEGNPCRRIRDEDLRGRGLDPVTVRRTFLHRYGLTFHAYQRAFRMGQALSTIRNGGDPTDAAMESGYNSDSGFHDAFERILGLAPKDGTAANPAWAKWIETPLGPMIAVAAEEGLLLLEFIDRRMLETQFKVLHRRLGRPILAGDHAILSQIVGELERYFEGRLRDFATPLHFPGSRFQVAVWKRLLAIPYGETLSYSALAAEIGSDNAQRAVGKANGDNRLAIVIPCHRVIRADGTLCGYGGGLWRKQKLLDLERGQGSLGV